MQRIAFGLLLLMANLTAEAEANRQDKPPSPAEQFKALRQEYDRASSTKVPLNDEERLKFVGSVYKHRHALAVELLQLDEKYPDGAIALDALMQAAWQV